MQQKPNAIIHMTMYGFVYGALLAMLYIWGFFLLDSLGGGADLSSLFGTAYFAVIFGGLPGAVMGFIEGWILWWLTRDLRVPLTQADFTKNHNRSIQIVGALTFLGMGAMLSLLFGGGFFSGIFLGIFVVLPALIAGGAAAYAARRYMLKLRAWGANFEKSKNKAKHTPRNNLTDDYDMSSDTSVDNVESKSQMTQDERR